MNIKKRMLSLGLITVLTAGLLIGCMDGTASADSPTMSKNLKNSSDKIAQNQSSLEKKQPAPQVDFSNERANLIRKVTTFNDPNKLGYIYLLSDTGVPIDFFVVKGKISNVSSYLVPDEQIVDDPYFKTSGVDGRVQSGGGLVVQSPDIDGSYGSNGEGIFFYEPDGTYHEWNGRYFYSDKPYKMTQQPLFIKEK